MLENGLFQRRTIVEIKGGDIKEIGRKKIPPRHWIHGLSLGHTAFKRGQYTHSVQRHGWESWVIL